MRTTLARPPLVLICSVTLGLVAWAADHVPSNSAVPAAAGLGNLPSHWLATAFLIGVIARGKLQGATFAGLGLALAVVVYYMAIHLAGDRPYSDLSQAARAWLAVAVIAGPIFGLAGATWRAGPPRWRPWAVALLAGALAGEAVYLAHSLSIFEPFTLRDTATVFAMLEIATAGALPFLMLRRSQDRSLALLIAVVCALVMAVATVLVIDWVREVISPF